jgi:uncharacterized protein
MSEQNVEVVRRAAAFLNGGDPDAAYQLLHPDIHWVIAKEHPDTRTLTGHEAVREYQQEWDETLPGVRAKWERLLDAGDRVVGIGTVRGTGTESGVDVQVPIAFLYTVEDGLITRVEEYLNPADALKAVGLEG